MFKWNGLDCSDFLPFPFCWKSLHFLDYFYAEQTVHFSPVCKCTIKELVASNHRMWTKAQSGQLFTCQPLILRWSRLPHDRRHPRGWHRQEGETSHLHVRQRPAPTRSCKSCTLQRWSDVEMFGSRTSPDWDLYLKHDPLTKKRKKINTTGVLFFLFFFLHSQCFTNHRNQYFISIFVLKVMLHNTSLKKAQLATIFFPEYIYNSDFYLAWCFSTVAYFYSFGK